MMFSLWLNVSLVTAYSWNIQSTPGATIVERQTKQSPIADNSASDPSAEKKEATHSQASETYGRLPLRFESNQGQTDERARFISRGNNFNVFLTESSAVVAFYQRNRDRNDKDDLRPPQESEVRTEVLRLGLAGANPQPKISGVDELASKTNYFIGNVPAKWRTNVSNFTKVKYEAVYPGIDLVYYGNQRQLEQDFVVEPGGNPGLIRLTFDGAKRLRVNEKGELLLKLNQGEIRQSKPIAYQYIQSHRYEIACRYTLGNKQQAGLALGEYDQRYPLVIDPVLSYSSYLGGSGADQAYSIAVDNSGNAYITGNTSSSDFPLANAYQSTRNNSSTEIFVSKLNASGTALVYSTYIGGGRTDIGGGIAVDSSGNAYITGYTFSFDYPSVNSLQPFGGGSTDAFATKLSAAGDALQYSTYLGGSGSDFANGIAVDTSGAAYVMGSTLSANFPTASPFQANLSGSRDVFVSKIDPTGTSLNYSTFLGGSGEEYGDTGIAVDSSGDAFVVGYTNSSNFPTSNALQPSLHGQFDMFISKFDPTGATLQYSTYLGGTGDDRAYSVAVDSSGNAYIAGLSNASGFPTSNALQPAFGGFIDAVVVKLNSTGSTLIYSTYLGGSGDDRGNHIAVDGSGNAYLTGVTKSTNFPTMIPTQATQGDSGAFYDAFVTKLPANGSGLVFSSYLGGNSDDYGYGIAVDSGGNAYVTGYTSSTNFPTASALQPTYGGSTDAFVTKISGLIRYSISGRLTDNLGAGIASASVAVTGTESFSTQTDANGNYSFASLAPGGNFTVTPSKSPYTFAPANQIFNNLSSDQVANFSIVTYGISGRVTDSGGSGVEAVTISITGFQTATAATDSGGYYSVAALPAGGNYTATPSKADPLLTYTFTPTGQSYSPLSANQTTNFTAATAYLNSLYPIADAYVQDGSGASTNFGAVTPLKAQTDNHANSGKNMDSYFMFDLSGVGKNITVAKLRIYAALSASGSVSTSAYGVTNTSWIEVGTGSITWNNKPARNASAITGATATVTSTSYATYDLDVTSYVTSEKSAGRDLISLALHDPSTSTPFISINSREAAANKPQLIITTGNNSNLPPAVSLSSPTNGATYTAPASVTLTASASDPDGTIAKVDFYAGTSLLGTATTSPYQISWGSVAVGNYSLSAVATDNLGAIGTSSAVNITVNPSNNPPTVTLKTPLNGTIFAAGSNISLSADASDSDGTISKVEFFAGATLVGTVTTPTSGSTYNFSWNNVASGAYALTAKATDNASGVITSSAININVVSQTGLPPAADAYVRDGSSASTNFGTATELQTQASQTAGSNRESYLRYDLTTVTGVAKATLRLYGRLSDTTGTNVPAAVYSVANTTWVESGSGSITWSNKPAAGATALATTTITDNVARWYEWDVTSYIQSEKSAGHNLVSFDVKNSANSSPYATFNSKEATADQPQLVLWTTQPRNVLLVVGSATLNTGDSGAKTRLENLGYTVTVKAAGTNNNAVNTSDAYGKALVVVSSTVTPANVGTKFRNIPIPVVNWEFDLLDDFGMTGTTSGTDFGTATNQGSVNITNATHPMAAGLSGTVMVVNGTSSFTWGKPNANSIKIAALTSDATKSVIFGYDGDVAMTALDAPARRVSLFLTDTTAATVTLTTGGGALFDAAVKWAAETITAPTIVSLTPAFGPAGTSVTVKGLNFGWSQGANTISFNGVPATVASWTDKNITVTVPAFATTGPVVVTVNGVASNSLTFAVGDTDVDADGLPDWWEALYFGNLNQGANDDPDGDGITNLQEYQQGRNPTKSALSDSGDFVGLKVHTPLEPSVP